MNNMLLTLSICLIAAAIAICTALVLVETTQVVVRVI